jgi:glycosyltransferase involved in cell wall biosynthesis
VLISVLIPCFNAERWIAHAIDSALAQTWTDKEVIVADDGSTDQSVDIIRKYGDRIRFEAAPHAGANPARNRLLTLSKGEWLQYLDADDYLLPEKISAQATFLAAHPDADIVFGPVTLEFATDGAARRELLPIPEPHDPWILLARWFLPQTGSPLWRKAAIVEAGGWKDDQPACQEHELYLRLLMAGKRFEYCDSNGAVYRQWSEGTLWKADKPRTRRLRLEIEARAETFLREHGALTPERLWAINQARFETARSTWQVDHDEAARIIEQIKASQPDFVPGGDAAPERYQQLYRLLGFRATETLADWRRQFSQ